MPRFVPSLLNPRSNTKVNQTPQVSKETLAIASGMAFVHNLIFRTLNAITLQYAQLTHPTDIADFLIYCQCFHEMVHSHHHHEETRFFPAIEAYSGVKGIMDTSLAQHLAFEEGLKKFGEYVYGVKVEEWDAVVFKEKFDGFTGALVSHLREEIPTLLALDKYGGEKLKKAWTDMEKEILKEPLDMVSLQCRG
jgi:hypothetical protein